MVHEERNVLQPLAQGWNLHRDDRETIIKVLTKTAVAYLRLKRFVGCPNHANVHWHALVIADSANFAFLQNAEQFCLERSGHRVDFVEENRAEVRFLEQSTLVCYRAGKGAFLVSKQLDFEQVLGQRAAIDRDEGMMLAIAVEMQPARDQLLACAAFALDEDGAVRVRDLVDQVINGLHSAGSNR